jgi:hypothetical protein
MSAIPGKSVLAVLGAAAILGWTPPVNAQDAPVLVGTWTLNIDKTEPAKDKVIEDAEGTGAGRTMSTGLGGRGASRRTGDVAGGGGSRAGGGGGGAGGGSSKRQADLRGMMIASRPKVTQADSIVTIEDEDGPLFVNLRSDGKTLEKRWRIRPC